jgi:hypothetical protein
MRKICSENRDHYSRRAIAIALGPGERTRLQHEFVEEIARDRQAICFCASVQSGRLAELVIVEMDEWARITALMKWERGLLRLERRPFTAPSGHPIFWPHSTAEAGRWRRLSLRSSSTEQRRFANNAGKAGRG